MFPFEYYVYLTSLILTLFASINVGKELASLEENNSMFASPIERNTLAEAIAVIDRRKREVSKLYEPYSSYRPLSRSRYRYPLYIKRSSIPSPDYYDDSYSQDYDYYDYTPRSSMFREREQGPKKSLIDNAYFSNKRSQVRPFLYQQSKRTSRHYPSMTRFFDTLDALKNRYNRDYYSRINGEDYSDLTRLYSPDYASRHFMTREKRSLNSPSASAVDLKPTVMIENGKDLNNLTSSDKLNSTKLNDKDQQRRLLRSDVKKVGRQKRAFKTDLRYIDRDRLRQEAQNDFLTREYFKTIARSVGNKKKRMAFASFKAPSIDKKSNLNSFLENPGMIHYVEDQLRETEEEIAEDAEKQLRSRPLSDNFEDPKTAMLLSNSISKMDAIEKMRDSLYELERLQEEDVIRKRAMSLVNGYDNEQESEKEKRRKSLRNAEVDKRKDDIFKQLFKGNKREECPVLERITVNCIAITQAVGDEAKAFLESCLRHEICYMCGSGLDVSRHECDALLSSALELSCSNDLADTSLASGGSLDCLSAAGDTYKALEDSRRYDDKGTCTYDPCVRNLLDSR